MAVNFYLDKRVDRHGLSCVRVSVSVRGVRVVTNTGLKVPSEKWDVARQRARKGSNFGSGMTWNVLNAALARVQEQLLAYEAECVSAFAQMTSENILAKVRDVLGRVDVSGKDVDSFWDVYARFVDERGRANQWTKATFQKFAALRHHLEAWGVSSLGAFSEAGMSEFALFLQNERGLRNSTVCKQFDFLRWFLNWAFERGYSVPSDYRIFTPKLRKGNGVVIFLEWEELMRVFEFSVPCAGTVVPLRTARGEEYTAVVEAQRGLEVSRDVFCLCSFTSLRFSDAMNLKWSDISGGALHVTMIKTGGRVDIELNKYALEILERHKTEDNAGYVFPRLTNQRMNKYLKVLCELCGINSEITLTYYRGQERIEEVRPKFALMGTHAGRRTFICNALMLGIPPHLVMKWTGHSDYKSMKPYIAVSDSAKASAMKLFDKL